jgi:hypothetical protein
MEGRKIRRGERSKRGGMERWRTQEEHKEEGSYVLYCFLPLPPSAFYLFS